MKEFSDGVYVWSNREYHASAAVGRSMLQDLKKSPFHYHYRHLSPFRTPDEMTPSLIKGEALHTMLLELDLFEDKFAVAPEINKRTKAGKEEWAAFEEANRGKHILTPEQLSEVIAMNNSVQMDDYAPPLLRDCLVEQTILFTHKETGIQCKVRPDAWNKETVIDVKTTADASYRAFQNSAYKFGYFLQAAMIKEALESIDIELQKFVFLCVENQPPYATATYILDREAIEYGVAQFDDLMGRLKNCIETNSWPAYDVQVLHLPNYANYD